MARRMTPAEVEEYAKRLGLTVGELFLHAHKIVRGFQSRNRTELNDLKKFQSSSKVPLYVSQFYAMHKEPEQLSFAYLR